MTWYVVLNNLGLLLDLVLVSVFYHGSKKILAENDQADEKQKKQDLKKLLDICIGLWIYFSIAILMNFYVSLRICQNEQ